MDSPASTSDGVTPVVARRAWRAVLLGPEVPPFGSSTAVRTLFGFVAGVVAFSLGAMAVELALGNPLAPTQSPAAARNLADALWHLGTAFLLVLPVRHRMLATFTPLLALGLDADHLFGIVAPTVVHREAHDLVFLLLVGVGLAWWLGRAGAFAAVAAALAHIAVDGGSFPLFAPASLAAFSLSWPESLALLAVSAVMLFVAVRPASELRRPGYVVPLALAALLVAALLALVPGVGIFNLS